MPSTLTSALPICNTDLTEHKQSLYQIGYISGEEFTSLKGLSSVATLVNELQQIKLLANIKERTVEQRLKVEKR
jgi:hypothetical protein